MFGRILPLGLLIIMVVSIPLASFAGGAATEESSILPDARGNMPPSHRAVSPAPEGTRDYAELPGWPMTMGVDPYYAPAGGPAMVDIDGDGRMEVFAGSTDRKLYGWRIGGTPLTGFPITLDSKVQSSPVVGDIDGDSRPEILVVSSGGYVYAFETNGTATPGWPAHPGGNGAMISIVLQDFDGDQIPEVVLPNGNNLYVWRGNGTNYPGFPVAYQSSYGACSTPAVGDLDGDGTLEIVVEGWEWMSVFHQNGTMAAGWPYHLPLSYEGFSYSSPALVDFDGDGYKEIAAAYHESGGGNWSGKVCIWRHNGAVVPGWPVVLQDFGSWCYSTPAVGDVDEDGAPEIAVDSHNGRLYILNFNGTNVTGFPVDTGYYNLEASCSIGDIDDDGDLETCVGSNQDSGVFMSYEKDGSVTPGFPLSMTGAMVVSGSCIGDPDGNGAVNICAHDKLGKVHMWDLPHAIHADRIPWGRPFHDDHHTGNVDWIDPAAVEGSTAPPSLRLDPAWPNPSAGRVSFVLEADPTQRVHLTIVDASGREIATLQDGPAGARERIFAFDPMRVAGAPVPAGVYFCRAVCQGRVLSRSFVHVR